MEDNARHIQENRAVLEFCYVVGVPWKMLGSELAGIRKSAQTHIPEYMADDFQVDITQLMQARFTVEDILRANGHDWNCGPLPSDAVSRISKR